MKYLIVIPARAGSKGLPRKNIYPLCGKPLISWTIDIAKESQVGDILVTTDSPEVQELCRRTSVACLDRPKELSTDDVPLAPVVVHAYKQSNKQYDAVITLQPTSPLLHPQDIIGAIKKFESDPLYDSLLSVVECRHSVWKRYGFDNLQEINNPKVNRQSAEPLYIGNGAIFITRTMALLQSHSRLAGLISYWVMPEDRSVDIHTIEDIKLAEYYLGVKK